MNKNITPRRAFTLVELLVTIAVIGVLAAILIPVAGAARARAQAAECGTRIRSLGHAVLLVAEQHRGEWPRSLHSAAAHGQSAWTIELAPVLDLPSPDSAGWEAAFNRVYRCPADAVRDVTRYSYGMNVYLEVYPGGDDYPGAPATWRRLARLPTPSRTLLLAEPRSEPFADHVMAHLWGGVSAARNALAHDRHQGRSLYAFCDGHIATLRPEETFDPSLNRDLWNPAKAR